jgi:riboflavin kinase/FMN adenylyltransferase
MPRAVTIGVYDGVHRGHRHVLELLAERARDLGDVESTVVTFDPHPMTTVAPERAPRMLTSLEHRLELLEPLGIDLVAVLTFDDAMRDLSPARFAGAVLDGALAASVVVVGGDFRFGRDRTGHVGLLRELGSVHGFETEIVDLVGGEEPVSSTAIRAMVAAGDVRGAGAALRRAHEIRGTVVPGDGRGRTIGIPTANVAVVEGSAVPARGVYAVWSGVVGEEPTPAVANIGVRPTFGGEREAVEVHLLDRDRDLYGRRVRLAFAARIRDERRFAGIDELVDQIRADIGRARGLLADAEHPAPSSSVREGPGPS